jgi:hypothetical protein
MQSLHSLCSLSSNRSNLTYWYSCSCDAVVVRKFDDCTWRCTDTLFITWCRDSYRETQQDATVYQNFIIPYFKRSWTCFGRHTAHHQEPKTEQAASGFAWYCGRLSDCSCWTLSGSVPDNVKQRHVRQPITYAKPEAAWAVLGSWWCAMCRPKHVELRLK